MIKKQELISKGVNPEKIIDILHPCVSWDLKKQKVTDDLSENNRLIHVQSYNRIDNELVNKINESKGILFYESFPIGNSPSPHYRFAFIPEN